MPIEGDTSRSCVRSCLCVRASSGGVGVKKEKARASVCESADSFSFTPTVDVRPCSKSDALEIHCRFDCCSVFSFFVNLFLDEYYYSTVSVAQCECVCVVVVVV